MRLREGLHRLPRERQARPSPRGPFILAYPQARVVRTRSISAVECRPVVTLSIAIPLAHGLAHPAASLRSATRAPENVHCSGFGGSALTLRSCQVETHDRRRFIRINREDSAELCKQYQIVNSLSQVQERDRLFTLLKQ